MSEKRWSRKATEERNKPKFLKKGTLVMVEPTEPQEITIDGKYGKRKMYVVETKEYGAIYVSNIQLIAINSKFNNDYSSAVTVEL